MAIPFSSRSAGRSMLPVIGCVLVVGGAFCTSARAGFLGHVPFDGRGENDIGVAAVNAVIEAYNAANTATLPLLDRFPNPRAMMTHRGNFGRFFPDFMFFKDADGTMMLNSGIQAETAVWFKYNNRFDLLYYTLKGGGQGYNVYQYMPGMLNEAKTPVSDSGKEFPITHLSFWIYRTTATNLPELGTWSMSLAALAVAALASSVGRNRIAAHAVKVCSISDATGVNRIG